MQWDRPRPGGAAIDRSRRGAASARGAGPALGFLLLGLAAACALPGQPPPEEHPPAAELSGSARTWPTPAPALTPSPQRGPTPTPPDPLQLPPTPEDQALARLLATLELRPRDYIALAREVWGTQALLEAPEGCRPRSYRVGERQTFWILDSDTQAHAQVEAVLSHISQHAYLWTQAGLLERTEQLREAGRRFDEQIYPRTRELFGEEWSPGGDCDARVHILHAGGLGAVTGSFKSIDAYPTTVVRTSNRREMFYMSVENSEVGDELYLATLAHEFQHMIHWRHDPNEDLWLNEGLSELAIFKNGLYGAEYGADEFFRRPETPLTSWPIRGDSFASYGASFLFALYLSEQFGDEFIYGLVADPANSVQSLDRLLAPYGEDFNSTFADWLVANYLDDVDLADGRFGYYELNPALPSLRHSVEEFPFSTRGDLPQYGAHYIRLRSTQDLVLEFQGNARIPLLPVSPHSGRYAWWSNRGDASDTRLTAEFDLRGARAPRLTFWTWYNLERDLDFVHLLASTDGGRTWEVIRASNMVEPDPLAVALGWGYTGSNAPVGEPVWSPQVADLSRYAGQRILLRFQMLTDAGIHLPGFYVDDLEIEEIGFRDEVEAPESNWEADGFVRSHNYLPQEWVLRLLELSTPPRVVELELEPTAGGRWTRRGFGEEFEEAVLVIAPLAPKTGLRASYSLMLSAP